MGIFVKNIEALKKKDSELAKRLCSPGIEPVSMERTESGEYTFVYRGRYFHSRYDPGKEATLQAEEVLSKESDWVILFGIGCGYLLERLVASGRKVMVTEPSLEILKGVLSSINLSDVLDNENVFVASDARAAAELVRNVVDGMDDIIGYQTPAYRQAFHEEIDDLTRRVRNAHTMNKAAISTEVTSGLNWVENYFENLESFFEYPAIDVLRGRFEGVPLVIAGAGPSLDKNAHVLKKYRDSVVVIAAITAFKPLLKHGVVPDLVIAAEKRDLPEFFTNGPDDLKTRFVLAEVAHSKMFERPALGKLVYFNPYCALSVQQAKFWGSTFFPANGGSVTTVALEIGRMFNSSPIIFIGQDLSYGGGKTHADDSFYHGTKVQIDAQKKVAVEAAAEEPNGDVKDLLWLKGLDGEPVPSRYDWVTFHQWFEKVMAEMPTSGSVVKVINATEGGAYIEGMEHTTLEKALAMHALNPVDADAVIRAAVADRPGIDAEALVSSFESMLSGVKEIARLSKGIVKTARKMRSQLKGGLNPSFNPSIEKIKKLEARLFERADSSAFIWSSIVAYTYSLKEYLRAEEEGTDEERFEKNLDALIDSYGMFERTAERFTPILDNAVSTVMQELADRTGLSA